ncbi:DUF4062 domain-containing protein [Planctomycetota bacterium]
MPKRWETIRVFISSTFRDMHAERNYLVRVVFPKLRERLEAYQYHLEDIDLRWGVTAEQADNDLALDLCLQQIDECRPFFVGILGERYGWVPKSFTDEAVSKYGWIQHQTGKSLTELEILYGVLKKKEMKRRAFFYFRDKAFIADVPAWKQAGALSEDEESAGKLEALKNMIRQSGPAVPCFDGYPCKYVGLKINPRLLKLEVDESDWETVENVIEDGFVDLDKYDKLDDHLKEIIRRNAIVYLDELKVFGDRVYEELWRAIKTEHNLPDTPPADTLAQDDPLAYEAQFHERFMESRTRIYIGREKIQRELMDYINGDDTVPCLVTGPSGSGKSSVLAKLGQTIELQNDNILLIPHFVGASPASTSLRQMLRRLCTILRDRFEYTDTIEHQDREPEIIPADIPFDIYKLIGCFGRFINDVPSDAHVVILIDALNQMDEIDHAHGMNWLPTKLHSHVKIVASCIDDPDKQEEVLKAFDHRRHHHIVVEPLTSNERLEIVREVPSLSAKTLDAKQVGLLLDNKATENPLFLLVALEELRGFGSFEHLNDRIRQLPKGGNANTEIFIQVIERLTDEFDAEVVEQVLCYLACSRIGMTDRELLELIEGIGVEESRSDLFPVLRQLRSYLQYRGEAIDFFHRDLFKAVQVKHFDTDDKKRFVHARLSQYFRKKADPGGDSTWCGNYPNGISELPYHLSKCSNREEYEKVLLDYYFMQNKLDAFGVQPLIEDYWLIKSDRNSPLNLVCRTLDLSMGVLVIDTKQLVAHLFGRLYTYRDKDQRIQGLLNQAKQCQHAPWLRPLSESLTQSSGPLVRTLEGHTSSVTSLLSVSDDFIVSGSWDHTLKVWDLTKGQCLRTLKGHSDRVCFLQLTSDGRIVSGSNDGTLKVWDFQSGQCLCTIESLTKISSLSLDSKNRLVSGSEDGKVKVWDTRSGECLRTMKIINDQEKANLMKIRLFSTTSNVCMVCGCGSTLKVWDIDKGKCLLTLEDHMTRITCLSIVSYGHIVCAAGETLADSICTLKVWDLNTGECLRTLEDDTCHINFLSLTSENHLVSGSKDGILKVWDLINGKCIKVLEGYLNSLTAMLLISDDRIMSASEHGFLEVLDFKSGESLYTLRAHVDQVSSLLLTTNGRVVSSSYDRTLKLWDISDNEYPERVEGHTGKTESLSLTSDGRVMSCGDKTLKLWDLATGKCLRTFMGHKKRISSISLTNDGRVVSKSSDHILKLWDIASGKCLRTFESHTDRVNSLLLTSNDRLVYGSSDGILKAWDLVGNEWPITIKSHAEISSLSSLPDGRVISGSRDGTLKVWSLVSRECPLTLKGHTDMVTSLSVTINGLLVSGSWDY